MPASATAICGVTLCIKMIDAPQPLPNLAKRLEGAAFRRFGVHESR